MWIDERGDGVNTCLDCGRNGRVDGGTYGSGMKLCEVHGVEGFDPKRVVVTSELTEADVRARIERGADDVRGVATLKASISAAMKARGFKPVVTHRYPSGRWLASVQGDETGHSWAQTERASEVEALVALANLLGVAIAADGRPTDG